MRGWWKRARKSSLAVRGVVRIPREIPPGHHETPRVAVRVERRVGEMQAGEGCLPVARLRLQEVTGMYRGVVRILGPLGMHVPSSFDLLPPHPGAPHVL